MHKCGILHNDLHAGNVILSGSLVKDSNVKAVICDLGLRYLMNLDDKYTFMQKYQHIAHELVGPAALFSSVSSDIFSFGVLLAYLKVIRFEHIAQKCLSSNPNSRPCNMDIVIQLLNKKKHF